MKSRGVVVVLAAVFLPVLTMAQAIAFKGATVVDGTGAAPFRGTVVVEGSRIIAAGPVVEIPAGARIIDAQNLTLIPGLFDVHTHISVSGGPALSADWPKSLMAYLYCGITTVADLGDYQENFEAVRGLLAAGTIQLPRLALATRFSPPGGHGAESGRPEAHSREVLTAREARAAMAEVLKGPKPDLIKIFADGWRYGTAPEMTSMQEGTIAALVEEAHRAGIPVITHTVTAERSKIAARAGVDILGHGINDADIDQEFAALLRSRGTIYVPTLAVYEPKANRPATPLLAEVLEPAFLQPPASPEPVPEGFEPTTAARAAQQRRWQFLLRNVALARQAAIPIAAGTDAGMPATWHGWSTLRELKLLVAGGMTPLEAITAATSVSARALRVNQERGTIAPGKLADLVLIDGHPHESIEDIEKSAPCGSTAAK